jgi:hypothetical protein
MLLVTDLLEGQDYHIPLDWYPTDLILKMTLKYNCEIPHFAGAKGRRCNSHNNKTQSLNLVNQLPPLNFNK